MISRRQFVLRGSSLAIGLVGTKFVVFVRAFAHPGDAYEADLRFHLAGDTPAELDAVKEATLLQQVRQ